MLSHGIIVTLASDIFVLGAALSIVGVVLTSLLLQNAKYLPIPIKITIRSTRSDTKESGDQV